MSFLYPLFLAAGAALAIPVLIHLFNLRKYKTVFFPHTRFLRNVQLNSQKQSQVRYKLLLAARLLFLACLILAFAQPFFSNNAKTTTGNKTQIIYLDNSYSMSLKKGQRSLLDIAKENAAKQVRKAVPGSRFLILTNDKPTSFYPVPIEKALETINSTDLSSATKNVSQVLASIQGMRVQATDGADVFYYSDFQQSAFPLPPAQTLMQQVSFYGIPLQTSEANNIYIDTAYLTSPVLETGKPNKLIVKTKAMGNFGESKENPVLQLKINGQVKSASSLNFAGKTESTDTLSFSVNNANWQEMELALNDASFKYDDTFRITARSAPNLSVLVINEGQPNPFIQAAFRAYNGFRLNQTDAGNAPTDWKDYNLVILNGTTRINSQLAKSLDAALQGGQSICVFPGKTSNFATINEGLALFADIHITGIDTATQAASNIQQGSNLIKGLFEKIPDNVQLPVANWHYNIAAGLSANQQSILSFRNGDPFMAQYAPSKGQLYICATAADLQSGNFPGSYFFTPFLYEMAMQSGSSSIYAITAGQQQPIYLPLAGATERNTIHVLGQGVDAIPPQKPDGAGIDIYLDQVVHQPGFYNLAAVGVGASTDTTKVALNQDKAESQLIYRDIKALQAEWKGDNIKWIDLTDGGSTVSGGSGTNFPIWKICILLAVVMLAAETYLLARPASLAGATGA